MDLDSLLNTHFAGRVVRKDLTKLVKEGANVPVYVLEYLLGQHCASDDEAIIEDGLKTVKRILAENYVRPDEAEKIKSIIRERGNLKIIDKVTVTLNEKRDVYEALLSNLGTKAVEISTATVRSYEKLLAGGIWSIITMEYFYEEGQKGSPFIIRDLKPIQMPNMDMALPAFVALCSAVLGKPVQSSMVVLGNMSLGGSIVPVENLADTLQVAFDAGAKRILLPMASVGDIPSIPGELFAKFQTSFYADPRDAAFKALGVE